MWEIERRCGDKEMDEAKRGRKIEPGEVVQGSWVMYHPKKDTSQEGTVIFCSLFCLTGAGNLLFEA